MPLGGIRGKYINILKEELIPPPKIAKLGIFNAGYGLLFGGFCCGFIT